MTSLPRCTKDFISRYHFLSTANPSCGGRELCPTWRVVTDATPRLASENIFAKYSFWVRTKVCDDVASSQVLYRKASCTKRAQETSQYDPATWQRYGHTTAAESAGACGSASNRVTSHAAFFPATISQHEFVQCQRVQTFRTPDL